MPDDTILRPSPSAVFRPLDTGGVVLDLTTGAYFELNATGRFLWEQMAASGISENALVDAASAQFGISQETAAMDVGTFLASLRERDLVDPND